jgi:hypothetical protein
MKSVLGSLALAAIMSGTAAAQDSGSSTTPPAAATTAPAAAEDAASSAKAGSDWSWSISPYVWAASLHGHVKPFPKAPGADVDVSFGDIFKHLDLAGMAIAEVRYRRFGAYADLVYTSISADADAPFGILFKDAKAENEIFIGTFGGKYRALDLENALIDLLAGARVWSVNTELNLNGNILSDRTFEHGETWVDPVVGIQGRYSFHNGIYLATLLQVGGFGVGSDLTWDALGVLGYQFNDSISAAAGYRHMAVDYHRDGFVFDVDLSGPVIGATINF